MKWLHIPRRIKSRLTNTYFLTGLGFMASIYTNIHECLWKYTKFELELYSWHTGMTRVKGLMIYPLGKKIVVIPTIVHFCPSYTMYKSDHDDVIKWKHFPHHWPLCGEFTGPGEFPAQRPVMRNFDVFFDLRLNKRLSKQTWGWWFETPSWSLWRHCNEDITRPLVQCLVVGDNVCCHSQVNLIFLVKFC